MSIIRPFRLDVWFSLVGGTAAENEESRLDLFSETLMNNFLAKADL